MVKNKLKVAMVLGLVPAMMLAGCGSSSASTASTTASTEEAKSSTSAVVSNAGSTEKVEKAENNIGSENGSQVTGDGTGKSYEARVGDTCNTAFFSYSINGTNIADSFLGYTPKAGKQLLIVGITVENTWRKTITMYDTDFQAQWDDTDDPDNAYAYPIDYQDIDDMQQLPSKYTLGVGESRWGTLIYEVPTGYTDFDIAYQEQFADGTTGDSFFTYFTSSKLDTSDTTDASAEAGTEASTEAATEADTTSSDTAAASGTGNDSVTEITGEDHSAATAELTASEEESTESTN